MNKRRGLEQLDAVDLFRDPNFDPDGFIDSVEGTKLRFPDASQRSERAAWQRLEDLRDARRLRAQLEDWED